MGILKDGPGLILAYPNGSSAGALLSLKNKDRKQFIERLQVTGETKAIKRIEPIPCRVKYRSKTKHGKLRHPVFEQFF
ncbi:MAG: hypothetical protein ABF820_03535 [Sporolactobacillus sp.]